MGRLCLAAIFAALASALAAAAEPASPPVSRFDALKPKLWSKDKAERQAAYDAYLREGAEGQKALADELLAIRKAALSACRDFYPPDDPKKALSLHRRLAEARAEALRVIFDTKLYPDADHGRAGQPIVDKAVDAVKAAYPSHRRAFDPLVKRFERVPRAYERIQEIDALLSKLGVKDAEPAPPLDKLTGCDPELLKALAELADYYDLCGRVLRYNRLIRTTMTSDERKLVELTNEYRMQLGLRPLAISEPLTQAARKHSQEMQRLGYFGHDSPTPANRSPAQRCASEGYGHFRGENCANGPATPDSAFRGWYNSSGHHRNMLGAGHTEIGVGISATLWTVDFGARPDLDLDNPPRSLPKPASPKEPLGKK